MDSKEERQIEPPKFRAPPIVIYSKFPSFLFRPFLLKVSAYSVHFSGCGRCWIYELDLVIAIDGVDGTENCFLLAFFKYGVMSNSIVRENVIDMLDFWSHVDDKKIKIIFLWNLKGSFGLLVNMKRNLFGITVFRTWFSGKVFKVFRRNL